MKIFHAAVITVAIITVLSHGHAKFFMASVAVLVFYCMAGAKAITK